MEFLPNNSITINLPNYKLSIDDSEARRDLSKHIRLIRLELMRLRQLVKYREGLYYDNWFETNIQNPILKRKWELVKDKHSPVIQGLEIVLDILCEKRILLLLKYL